MNQKKRIRVLASDVGGVIVLFKRGTPSGTIKDFAEMLWYYTKVPWHHFQKFLEIEPGTPEYDFILGRITPKQFYWEISKITNAYYSAHYGKNRAPFPSYRRFKKAWCSIFIPNVELLVRLRELSGAYKIVLASNLDVWHYDLITDLFQLNFINYEESVFSFKDHLIKPDPAFFDLLIKRCGVSPEEIFFFDDRVDNCQSAYNCGIEVYQFVDNESFFKELERRNIVKYVDGDYA